MIRLYYLATVLFLLLDILFEINVRVAFLENQPVLRASYYAMLFTCMVLILWRPSWTAVISGVESLLSLAALIISMALRSMLVSDTLLETGAGVLTMPEIINFLIVGMVGYLAFVRGMNELQQKTRIC